MAKKTRKPSVSVLMTFYDSGSRVQQGYLAEAVRSILAQTFQDFELVLVVSGKREFAKKLAKKSRKIRLFFFEQPIIAKDRPVWERRIGIVQGRNISLAHARSGIVAFADADDICLPSRLEVQYEYMLRHPEIGVLGSSIILIENDGRRIGVRGARENDPEIKRALLAYSPFAQPSVMARRSVLLKAGGYRTKYLSEDYDLWVRAAKITKFHNMQEPLAEMRLYGGNTVRYRRLYAIYDMPIKLEAARTLGMLPGPSEIAANLCILASFFYPNFLGQGLFQKIRTAVERNTMGLKKSE